MYQRLPGVAPGGLLERRHAVGDGLDAGDRGAARGEGVQHDEQRGAHQQPVVPLAELDHPAARAHGLEAAGHHLGHADPQQHDHVDHEEVGGDGEDLPRLPHAPEVAERDDPDEARRRSAPGRFEHVERRDQGRGARGGRHRHGQDVVDEQRGPRHLGGDDAEVVLRHQVRAAGRGVLLDRLPVGEDQEAQHHQHRDGDGHHQRERRQADHRHEDVQDLLGRVRRRREVVRGEDGEGRGLAEPLVLEFLGGSGLPSSLRLTRPGGSGARSEVTMSEVTGVESEPLGDPCKGPVKAACAAVRIP